MRYDTYYNLPTRYWRNFCGHSGAFEKVSKKWPFFWSSVDRFGPFSRTADRIAAPPTGMDRGRYGAYICGASRVLRVKIDVGTCENVILDEKNAIFPESFAAAPLNENMLPRA
jgi:hypothetical protein